MKIPKSHEFNSFLQDKSEPLYNNAEYDALIMRIDNIERRLNSGKPLSKGIQEKMHLDIQSAKYILSEYDSAFKEWRKKK